MARLLLVLLPVALVALSAPTDLLLQKALSELPATSQSDGVDWRKSGWADPRINGGQMLDFTLPDLGEPINVIISGLSDPHVLTHEGLHRYAKSLGFSEECLGMHIGNLHEADLGDGDGRKTE
ncbi:hypothetical protein FRB99_003818, partial [Tulasnella sp. 403]